MDETDEYLGATRSELASAPPRRRFRGMVDQRQLFSHAGRLVLRSDALVLGGWRDIARTDVVDVALTFTDLYRRGQAGGFRGQYTSLGVLGDLGKPIVLGLRGEEPVYLLVGFRWLSGTTADRRWADLLRSWAGTAGSTKWSRP